MLQQTQVKTVLPYFERFMDRFPNVEGLAAATEQEVLSVWSGLGYYRRAKALHRAAKMISEEGDGRFPETLEEWLALPGVGRYTAGAILSIAYGKRYPILDGNVARVLSRLFLIGGDPRSTPSRKILWQKAEDVLPQRSVSDFNQGLMELGAMVCTPRAPKCLVCPVRVECEAFRRGLQERLPELAPRKAPVQQVLAAAIVRSHGKVLLYQRHGVELMPGLWELPGGECGENEEPRAALVREARERYGLRLEAGNQIARVRHTIMNRKITLHAFEARLRGKLTRDDKARVWLEPENLTELPVSSMTLKVLRAARQDDR
jgi:A/G-specific adenine glycosylase